MSFEETRTDPTTPTQEQAAEQPETQLAEPPVQQATPETSEPTPDSTPEPVAASAPARAEKEPGPEDFAAALETFEQEQAQTEAALNEEQVITGTVLEDHAAVCAC